jgi:nicotinamide-nucleotide amidase
MKAEIITIGDEILIGQVIDTNSAWIAEKLNLLGIRIKQISSVSDDFEHILNSLEQASQRVELIIITGGLGPTRDDKTKVALCTFFDTKLTFHEDAYKNIERLFLPRNLKITEENRKQAELPENCLPLKNSLGTAFGMWFDKDGKIFVSLPGVPYEMKYLMENEVLPRLKDKFELPDVVHKTVLTHGIGESWLAEKIESWEDSLPVHISLAYLPSPGMVRLRLTGIGNKKAVLEKDIIEEIVKLKEIIPHYIFGYDDDKLEDIAGKLLISANATLSVAESCTGGYISHLITSVSGSSIYYKGGIVSYANEIKTQELNVKNADIETFGAVSKEVVEQMAIGAKEKFNTEYSLATSGIAGPTGGTEEKPVGTFWIAMAFPGGVYSKKYLFGDNRERNILKAANTALNLLRLKLQGLEF